MARTTAAAVRAALLDNYDAENNLDSFILTANAMTDYVASRDTAGIMSAALLERIECYLACHFYCVADPMYSSKSTSGASGSFHGQTREGLASTTYGLQAVDLDLTKTLAKLRKESEEGGRRIPSIRWLGKPPSEQIPVTERS